MKAFTLSILFGLMMVQATAAQSNSHPASLDIMTTAIHSESFHSVPLKVSISGEGSTSEITFSFSDESSGEIFLTGTPYDSLGVSLPAVVTLSNQYGESAELNNLRILYGSTDDQLTMDVLPSSDSTMIQVPTNGRIHLRMGGEMKSENRLRGTFTGRLKFTCDKGSEN